MGRRVFGPKTSKVTKETRINTLSYGVVLVLAVVFLFQAVFSMWDDSPTFDEIIAPAIGYAELLTGDLGLVDDHPPLYRTFIALPLFLAFKPAIPLSHDSWQRRAKGMQDRYDFAHEFFYTANHNADRMLFWSRLPVVFLSLVLGLLVFGWAKELYGQFAGLFALFLYCFEPNIIAHSRLTTNDLILTLFIFLTIFQFWHYRNAPSLRPLILTGISLGLALLSKFSAVMLLPMLFLLAFLAMKKERKAEAILPFWTLQSRGAIGSIGLVFNTLFLISIIALGVVLLFYGAQWRLFIHGVYNAVAHYQGGHYAFLLGSYSTQGWWYYFPIAFLLKTPIPLLIYILVAFLFLSFRKDKAEYFLLVPVGIIISLALLGHINIGIRHILPIYPFLIVLASSIATVQFTRPRFFFTCFGGLALWYLFSTLSIFPSYLAYFNEFVGPQRGYRALVDSNLDWGQDLKRLKQFMDKERITQIYLSYFGTANPCYYGIRFKYLPGSPSGCGEKPNNQPTDFIAVSATNLQSVYFSDKGSFEWLKSYKPIAQIGYSIFVYDIKGDAYAHNDLGVLYLKYRMPEEALNEFKLAVELKPKEAAAHTNLGITYGRLSMPDKAEEAFKKALQLDPESSAAKEGLKGIYSQAQKRLN